MALRSRPRSARRCPRRRRPPRRRRSCRPRWDAGRRRPPRPPIRRTPRGRQRRTPRRRLLRQPPSRARRVPLLPSARSGSRGCRPSLSSLADDGRAAGGGFGRSTADAPPPPQTASSTGRGGRRSALPHGDDGRADPSPVAVPPSPPTAVATLPLPSVPPAAAPNPIYTKVAAHLGRARFRPRRLAAVARPAGAGEALRRRWRRPIHRRCGSGGVRRGRYSWRQAPPRPPPAAPLRPGQAAPHAVSLAAAPPPAPLVSPTGGGARFSPWRAGKGAAARRSLMLRTSSGGGARTTPSESSPLSGVFRTPLPCAAAMAAVRAATVVPTAAAVTEAVEGACRSVEAAPPSAPVVSPPA